MSNTNYIQETETIQQIKKFWQYVYLLRHIPTGKLYVGSRSKKSVLKKFEDCYTDKYLGSSRQKEGPFSEIDTETNPHDYEKTVLKVFYDSDPNKAWKYENGENGLIMTYWNLYGKDKVLNQHCILNDGSKVFSFSGNKHSAASKQKISQASKGEKNGNFGNKHSDETKQYLSEYSKNLWQNLDENIKKQKEIDRLNTRNNWSDEKKKELSETLSLALKGKTQNKYYHCPYEPSKIGIPWSIKCWIAKFYPNEKQWNEFTKQEKESYRVISPVIDVD